MVAHSSACAILEKGKMTTGKPDRFREHLFRRLRWEELDAEYLRQLVELARAEDLEGAGLKATPASPRDVTTEALAGQAKGSARLVARNPLCICGLGLIPVVLDVYGGTCNWSASAKDGTFLKEGGELGVISGPASTILQAERILLNFLQHLCGIATGTAHYVKTLGWSQTRLLDTRKTTPGLRMLEKYAVACGGGWNHRLGLFDRVMLKDNHLAATGAVQGAGLAEAIRLAHQRNPDLAIEVEIDALTQIDAVLEAGADVILLDNFSTADLAEAVSLIAGHAYTEASGGITLGRLPDLADLGLDFISCGALIHHSAWADIGLDWKDA